MGPGNFWGFWRRSKVDPDCRLGMLIRVTNGLSGAGGAAYQTDADFFMAGCCGPRCGGSGAFSSCPRACAAAAHDEASPPGPRWSWCSPRRNSSMSARRVLRRSGSSNGYDADDGDVVIAACCTFTGGGGELVDERFSRRAHTSFMAHFRFCLLTNDPSPAVVPMGELWKIQNIISEYYAV